MIRGVARARDGAKLAWQYLKAPAGAGASPVVLVGGWASDANLWATLPPSLYAEGHGVLAFDHRGVGASTLAATDEKVTIDTLADDVLAVADDAGINEKAHLLGVSMGGMVAQRIALSHADALPLASLTLGCTTHGGKHAAPPPMEFFACFDDWDDGDDARRAAAEAFLGHGLMCTTPSSTDMRMCYDESEQRWAARDGANGDRRFAALVDEFLATPRTRAGIMAQRGALMRFNTRDELAALRDAALPVHVVHGDGDAIMPRDNARMLEEAVGGGRVRTTVLEGVGHLWWLGGPQRRAAVDAVANFLRDAEE